MFWYLTLALLSIGPRSIAATIGNPSVLKKLPSTAAATLFHRSLAKKSNFGLLWLPYCGLSSSVRRVGRLVMMLMTPPIAIVAVQARRRVLGDLDAIDADERHARPVHPAAERIVERDAVEQDERAALAARPDAAQRHALRGRLRDEAAGAAEQAEASAPAAARRRRPAPATPRSLRW